MAFFGRRLVGLFHASGWRAGFQFNFLQYEYARSSSSSQEGFSDNSETEIKLFTSGQFSFYFEQLEGFKMRRRVGVGAIQDKRAAQGKFKDKGTAIQENLVEELSKQLDQFKDRLESFAVKHQDAIKKDPAFREHFQEMCASIGVDPLASSKGFWSELLGMGSFYYEIAVQSVEIVLATSQMTGGVMLLGEVQNRLSKSRKKNLKNTEISCEDIHRAMKSLNVLGKSCGIILPPGKHNLEEAMVFCVPEELSLDNTTLVTHAVQSGMPFLTVDEVIKSLGWKRSRVESVFESLIREGIVWIDDHGGSRSYWFPSIFTAARLD